MQKLPMIDELLKLSFINQTLLWWQETMDQQLTQKIEKQMLEQQLYLSKNCKK
jgi:hypothetical protein